MSNKEKPRSHVIEQEYADGTRKYHIFNPEHGEKITPDGYNFHGTKKLVEPYTMTVQKKYDRLESVWRHLMRICNEDIPGDFVETGIWEGGMGILATDYLRFRQQGDKRKVWLYDTFEGMPKPSKHEDDKAWERYTIFKKNNIGWCEASLESVKENFKEVGLDLDNPKEHQPEVKLIKGKVEDTLKDPENLPEKICLLRCDTDFYESTVATLEHLWDRVVPGGVVIFDDYGRWRGQRKAVDDFFRPLLALDKNLIHFRNTSKDDRSCIWGIKNS